MVDYFIGRISDRAPPPLRKDRSRIIALVAAPERTSDLDSFAMAWVGILHQLGSRAVSHLVSTRPLSSGEGGASCLGTTGSLPGRPVALGRCKSWRSFILGLPGRRCSCSCCCKVQAFAGLVNRLGLDASLGTLARLLSMTTPRTQALLKATSTALLKVTLRLETCQLDQSSKQQLMQPFTTARRNAIDIARCLYFVQVLLFIVCH